MGLFSSNKKEDTKKPGKNDQKKPETGPPPVVMNQILNVNRRLRIIEERYRNVQKQIQFTEESLVGNKKTAQKDMGQLDTEVLDLTHQIENMKEQIEGVISELQGCAKQEDVALVQKYIEMWEPLDFVQREEAKKIVADIVSQVLKKN